MIRLQVRTALERSRATEELVKDDTKGPVVTRIAQIGVAERFRCKVLLSAYERVHARVFGSCSQVRVVLEAHAFEKVIPAFEGDYLGLNFFIEYFAGGKVD